jgi:hypothetical protein
MLLDMCDEREKHDAAGAQATEGFSLIESAESSFVNGVNPRSLLQYRDYGKTYPSFVLCGFTLRPIHHDSGGPGGSCNYLERRTS